MAETEAVVGLRLMFQQLPDRSFSLGAVELRVLSEGVSSLYGYAKTLLNVDPARLGMRQDKVDMDLYPNWANLAVQARDQIAQLQALFDDPDRYVRVNSRAAETAFGTMLLATQALYDRLGILLDGKAGELHGMMGKLPRMARNLSYFTAARLEQGIAELYEELIKGLQINPARLAGITDNSNQYPLWIRRFSQGSRDQVARIRAICMDPMRFVLPSRMTSYEDAFEAACRHWRHILVDLALESSL